MLVYNKFPSYDDTTDDTQALLTQPMVVPPGDMTVELEPHTDDATSSTDLQHQRSPHINDVKHHRELQIAHRRCYAEKNDKKM